MSALERGFKTWSERLAVGIRRDLQKPEHAPLPPVELASYLGVTLWTPGDVPGIPDEVLNQLLEQDPWGWSAVTQTVGERVTVIYNPRHSSGRRASNIAHELAHVLLDHEPGRIILSPDGGIAMRTFDGRQEDEAGWLSGCLLLPRLALVRATRAGLTRAKIADDYGVTEVLVNYRIRVCGVEAQMRAATVQRRRPSRN